MRPIRTRISGKETGPRRAKLFRKGVLPVRAGQGLLREATLRVRTGDERRGPKPARIPARPSEM